MKGGGSAITFDISLECRGSGASANSRTVELARSSRRTRRHTASQSLSFAVCCEHPHPARLVDSRSALGLPPVNVAELARLALGLLSPPARKKSKRITKKYLILTTISPQEAHLLPEAFNAPTKLLAELLPINLLTPILVDDHLA